MDMTMSNTRPAPVEVLTSVQRRRRWTPQQKLEIIQKTNEPGSSVSAVAREFGISANLIFHWRKCYLEGSLVAVGANEPVVPSSRIVFKSACPLSCMFIICPRGGVKLDIRFSAILKSPFNMELQRSFLALHH